MRLAAALTSILMGVAAAVVTANDSVPQKPVRTTSLSVLYVEPPPTADGLFKAAQAIVVVRVTSIRGFEGTHHTVWSEISGTILDVPKPDSMVGAAGSPITFVVRGGEIDRGSYIERTRSHHPPLVPVHEYLVVLAWNSAQNALYPPFGPGGIFELVDGKLVPLDDTRLARSINGMSLPELSAAMMR